MCGWFFVWTVNFCVECMWFVVRVMEMVAWGGGALQVGWTCIEGLGD